MGLPARGSVTTTALPRPEHHLCATAAPPRTWANALGGVTAPRPLHDIGTRQATCLVADPLDPAENLPNPAIDPLDLSRIAQIRPATIGAGGARQLGLFEGEGDGGDGGSLPQAAAVGAKVELGRGAALPPPSPRARAACLPAARSGGGKARGVSVGGSRRPPPARGPPAASRERGSGFHRLAKLKMFVFLVVCVWSCSICMRRLFFSLDQLHGASERDCMT